MRVTEQQKKDRQRKTYRLSFPSTLDPDQVTNWLRAISGTMKGKNKLAPLPTVAFEMWATSEGIRHRVKVPWQHAEYVMSQLLAHVPGIRYEEEDEWPRRDWTTAVEVGLRQSTRQLRIYSAAATSTSLLAAVQALGTGETVLMQWVATPAAPARLPQSGEDRDALKDIRTKLTEPNIHAVLRIAAYADTDKRANHLLYRVKSALASTRAPSIKFIRRLATPAMLQQRIDHVATPWRFPIRLSAPEMTALLSWPIGNPFITGLPQPLSRRLPVTDIVPREGRVIGRSNMPGAERKVAISYAEAVKHVHVCAPTGGGKTTLLANMFRQDVAAGYGAIVMESKGDLFYKALDYIPYHRLQDVIVMDVNDNRYPVGFNILQQGDPLVVIDEIVDLFGHLYRDAGGVYTKEVLYHGLRTLAGDPKYTFIDLATLLVPQTKEETEWADNLIRNLDDKELRQFWQRFTNKPKTEQDRISQPVMDRIWQLNARPEIRNIIGQSGSSFSMAEVLKGNKIFLVNLAGLPKDTTMLTGTLMMNALWHAVKTTRTDTPSFLYLDEFQDFINLPVDPSDMLAKARSFGLGMTLAHQHLGQLPTELRGAVLANARTKIVFQTTNDDAKVMAREFGTQVTEEDFLHLGRFEGMARIATPDGVSSPLTFVALEPGKGENLANDIRGRSRDQYAKPLQAVEQEIAERRKPEQVKQKKRPHIGGVGDAWGQ